MSIGQEFIVGQDDLILITGITGFIGSKLTQNLLNRGFRNLRLFVRPSSRMSRIEALKGQNDGRVRVEIMKGNLLSREDAARAAAGTSVIYHLAAGTGQKSYPDAYMNSVVTTRNLLEAAREQSRLQRFVNVSSFAVYSNMGKPQRGLLDESCPLEDHSDLRGEAYCFAKVKQDQIVTEYGKTFGVPYVIVRPGQVYGAGKDVISGRVGIDTFGIFLHLGGSNPIPLTYIDNCAEAIALAGLAPGVDGEIFNIVDDDLPSSRKFLRLYKKNVKRFPSWYLPKAVSYALCYLWESYSTWSENQLPPAFNRRRWNAYWRKTAYSNQRLKTRVGWRPVVSTAEGLNRYFHACKSGGSNA